MLGYAIFLTLTRRSFPDELAWNAFIRYRIHDAALDEVRLRCARLAEEYPPQGPERLLSEAGEDVLREIIAELEWAG